MRILRTLSLVLCVATLGCSSNEPKEKTSASSQGAFAPVAEVLERRCIGCHAAGGKKGYDFRSFESLMAGGRSGPAVVPGGPANSLILRAVRGQGVRRMPPAGEPLSEEDIRKIEAWIADGAKK
ncbi:MAG: c-type cytochrome [Fimbriimonadales bacterium]|nr:c-type cytochrome [Fimbriimonadales bacterium]